ncbi:MAG: exonuclease domain-containing protein [Candidatus Dadabacteria bacterium]|nr:exonuclease domain-containing protein [Candidatus Dadabacteria bacterium]
MGYLKRLASEAGLPLPQYEPTKQEASEAIDFLLAKLGRKVDQVIPDWSTLLGRSDVMIVDTETTGIGPRSQVIEVAVLDTAGFPYYHALSLPQGRISPKAIAIHGLSRERLRAEGARPWPEVHWELVETLSRATVVLAWNAGFDRRLLAQTAERHGLTMPELPWHDLMADYRILMGERRGKGWHTLSAAVRRSGARVSGQAHRAMRDCEAVLAVMRAV